MRWFQSIWDSKKWTRSLWLRLTFFERCELHDQFRNERRLVFFSKPYDVSQILAALDAFDRSNESEPTVKNLFLPWLTEQARQHCNENVALKRQ